MHQDLLQPQAYQNPSMTKNAKSQDRDILKSPWLMPWGTLTKIAHFFEILLSHDSLLGHKWPKQLWTKKPTLSKQSLHKKKRCFNLESHLWRASLPRVDKLWEWKKKTKRKMIVMSCTWKIQVESKWKSRESKKMLRKWWKTA